MAIDIDSLADEVVSALEEYTEEITEDIKEAVTKAGKHGLKVVKEKSPEDSGDYKKGWKLTTAYDGLHDRRVILHNHKKPQLTHLLEEGHDTQDGGRVGGTPHISVAEKEAVDMFEKTVEEILQK